MKLRNSQALIGGHGEQLEELKSSWKLEAPPSGFQTTSWDLLCKSHTRYSSHVTDASSRKGCKRRSQESPVLFSMGGTEHVCVGDQSLAPSLTAAPASSLSTAKGSKQNHLSCPNQSELGMQCIVWSRMAHTCSLLPQHPQKHPVRAPPASAAL